MLLVILHRSMGYTWIVLGTLKKTRTYDWEQFYYIKVVSRTLNSHNGFKLLVQYRFQLSLGAYPSG